MLIAETKPIKPGKYIARGISYVKSPYNSSQNILMVKKLILIPNSSRIYNCITVFTF